MKLGIFGGSFNPVHRAHVRIARTALRQLGLDKVLVIPARHTPLKDPDELAPARDRLRMARLAFRGIRRMAVSSIEIRRRGTSYTIDTLRALRRRYPRAQLFLIIGGDMAERLRRWRKWREIARLVTFAVVARPRSRIRMPPECRFVRLRFAPASVSATEIRRRVRAGQPIDKLVAPAVARYIERHRLYSRNRR